VTNIRRVILELDQDFGGMPSWRFIDPSVQPAIGENPLTFAWERKAHLSLFNGSATAELIAIKAGDVNNSISLGGNGVGPRSSRNIVIRPTENEFELEVQLEDADVVATQYRLRLSGEDEFVAVKGLAEGRYVISGDRKVLTVALAGREASSTYVIQLNGSAKALKLDESYTPEAYDLAGSLSSLSLKQVTNLANAAANLSFNPTLLKDQSILESSEQTSLVGSTLLVTDALGRVLLDRVIESESFELNRSDLPAGASGSLIYTVTKSQRALATGILFLSQ